MRFPVFRRAALPRRARLRLTVGLAAWLAWPAAAVGDPGDACVSSYEGAQAARKGGQLVRSKAELRLCLGACPTALAADCRRWLAEVSGQLAQVTVTVRGRDAATVEGARLFVDGVERPAGAPLELDPGPHELVAEAPGHERRAVELEARAGATSTQVITLRARRPTTEDEPRRPSLVGPLALGGVGLAALTAAAALAIAGHVDVSSMKESCAPRCPQSRVDTVSNLWTAAGVLTAVGGATTIGAGVWLGISITPEAALPPGRAGRFELTFGGVF